MLVYLRGWSTAFMIRGFCPFFEKGACRISIASMGVGLRAIRACADEAG